MTMFTMQIWFPLYYDFLLCIYKYLRLQGEMEGLWRNSLGGIRYSVLIQMKEMSRGAIVPAKNLMDNFYN